jgi:hypothetical protein
MGYWNKRKTGNIGIMEYWEGRKVRKNVKNERNGFSFMLFDPAFQYSIIPAFQCVIIPSFR